VTILNLTNTTLVRKEYDLKHGTWDEEKLPPEKIASGNFYLAFFFSILKKIIDAQIEFASMSKLALSHGGGTQGQVAYEIASQNGHNNLEFLFQWRYPPIGDCEIKCVPPLGTIKLF
jgi:hypothetical protein